MFDLILDSVEDFHTVEDRRLHRIFGGLNENEPQSPIQTEARFHILFLLPNSLQRTARFG